MAFACTRIGVEAHGGSLLVRVYLSERDGRLLKSVLAPLDVDQAELFRDELSRKIEEARCQPEPHAACFAKKP